MFKIVETDNFGGDYPNEKEVNIPYLNEEDSLLIVTIINKYAGIKYWKVVDTNYILDKTKFEP